MLKAMVDENPSRCVRRLLKERRPSKRVEVRKVNATEEKGQTTRPVIFAQVYMSDQCRGQLVRNTTTIYNTVIVGYPTDNSGSESQRST